MRGEGERAKEREKDREEGSEFPNKELVRSREGFPNRETS